jgi:hypothetical protein
VLTVLIAYASFHIYLSLSLLKKKNIHARTSNTVNTVALPSELSLTHARARTQATSSTLSPLPALLILLYQMSYNRYRL